jgi:hypothetical protein
MKRSDIVPQRFYVVSQRVSDAAPFWFDYILDVKQDGKDVLVRSIRIAPENEYCPGFVQVRATERRLPDTPMRQMVKHNGLCSIQENDADQAIADALPKTRNSIFESVKFGIVAQCQQAERLFRLPYPETVDLAALDRRAPRVAALYRLESEIYTRAFGKKDVFHRVTPDEDMELLRFGASLVEELRSGMYDFGFADENSRELCRDTFPCGLGLTRQLLEGFEGPGSKPHEPTATLLDPEKYHLVKYAVPLYPRLATLARIEGRVEMDINVERASGTVKEVHAVSGPPILRKAAEDAVKDWIFQPAPIPLAHPISAVLNFSLGCTKTTPQ